jgi:uncharacterized protein (DUF486 family)
VKLLENIAQLFKVKTIVTLMVMIIFAVLCVNGEIRSDSVMQVVTMVIAFYFGTQSEKNGQGRVLQGRENNEDPH